MNEDDLALRNLTYARFVELRRENFRSSSGRFRHHSRHRDNRGTSTPMRKPRTGEPSGSGRLVLGRGP